MSESEKKVRRISEYIKRVLRKAGAYSPKLSYQVELVASDILVYRKLRASLLSDECQLVSVEKSREGYDREKINPLIAQLRLQSKIVQEGLDKLTMNIKSQKKEPEAEDPLAKLTEYINSGEDD